jgi:hypothetical protein
VTEKKMDDFTKGQIRVPQKLATNTYDLPHAYDPAITEGKKFKRQIRNSIH